MADAIVPGPSEEEFNRGPRVQTDSSPMRQRFGPGFERIEAVVDFLNVPKDILYNLGGASRQAFDSDLPTDERLRKGAEAGIGTLGYALAGPVLGKALGQKASQIIPEMFLGVSGPETKPLDELADKSRRDFMKGAAATAGVAALAPEAITEALEKVPAAVKRVKPPINPIDMFAKNIKVLRDEMNAAYDAADELAEDLPPADPIGAPTRPFDEAIAEAEKLHMDFDATTEMDMRELISEIGPKEIAGAADESLEELSQALTDFRMYSEEEYIEQMIPLAKEIQKRGLLEVKDKYGLTQYPYARTVFEDVQDYLRGDKFRSKPFFDEPPNAGMKMTDRDSIPVEDLVKRDQEDRNRELIRQALVREFEVGQEKGLSQAEIDEAISQKRYQLEKKYGIDFSKADGGEMRKGVGSLSEIARRMNEGGEASKQMGDLEYEADMRPYLHDALSQLGFDPKKVKVGKPNAEDHYSVTGDEVTLDPNYGLLSKETQAHEFRHRGLQRLYEDYFLLEPWRFKEKYGKDAYNLMVKMSKQQTPGKRGRVEESVHERIAEMFQRPSEVNLGTVYNTSDARVFQTIADAQSYAEENPGVTFEAQEIRPNLERTIETPRVSEFRDYMINKNRGETMQQGTDAEFEAVRNIQNAAADVLAGRYATGGEVYIPSQEELDRMVERIRNQYGFDPVQVSLDQGVDPELALRLVMRESSGDQSKVSEDDAVGLTQLLEATAKEVGVDRSKPLENFIGGLRYLKKLQARFGPVVGLAAYNAGPGNVEKYGGGIPPFKETQNFVQAILSPMTGVDYGPQIQTDAETALMQMPVKNQNYDRPRARPGSEYGSTPLSLLSPILETEEIQPVEGQVTRPRARPNMVEKYGLPGDMPQGIGTLNETAQNMFR